MSTRGDSTRRTLPQQNQTEEKEEKNVPMVLKMLYNWDDMHIFGVAFPKTPPKAQL